MLYEKDMTHTPIFLCDDLVLTTGKEGQASEREGAG